MLDSNPLLVVTFADIFSQFVFVLSVVPFAVLSKEAKNLHLENFKMLTKETEDDKNRWKDMPCAWTGRINIVKMIILPQAIHISNAIPTKIPHTLEHIILKFVRKYNSTKIVKTVLRKNNRAEGIMLPDFKLYLKAAVVKTVWYWQKNRYIEKWNRIEPRKKPHTSGQLIYDKGGKIYNGKKIDSSITAAYKGMKLEHSLTAYTKISSKWT